jgi:hypothetical protein
MNKLFVPLDNLHLGRFAIFLGGIIGGWSLLDGVIPEPIHSNLLKIFLFLSAVIGFVLNSYKGNKKENNINADIKTNATINNVNVDVTDSTVTRK